MDAQGSFTQNARRKVLGVAVSAMLHESGFALAERPCIDTLVELLQALVSEIGRSSRGFCELSGRTDVLIGDVVLALIEMGLDVNSIPIYGRTLLRSTKIIVPTPAVAPRANVPKILQAGEKRPLSSYIPEYFPPFPDPHSYIRTPTHKQPVTEYEAIREKSASQKRDVERALTRFMAKTSDSSIAHNLFPDEHMSNLFPLISLHTTPNPYLFALLPRDQIFEDDEEEEVKEAEKKEEEKKDSKEEGAAGEASETQDGENEDGTKAGQTNGQPAEPEVPDNPYLRPAKIAKKGRRP